MIELFKIKESELFVVVKINMNTCDESTLFVLCDLIYPKVIDLIAYMKHGYKTCYYL